MDETPPILDFFLRADTEDALAAALPFARDDNGWAGGGHSFALDLIGPIETTPAVYDAEGNVVTPAVVDAAFHANLRLLDETLAGQVPQSVQITVINPRRVWA